MDCARGTGRRARGATGAPPGTGVLASAALALLLAGCVASAGVLQVGIDAHAPQYVRGQIINAMGAAGYRKISFSSFDTRGIVVPEVRSARSDQYRFQSEGDAAYVARVYFDKPQSTITVRLDEMNGAHPAGAGSAELARIRDALRDEFGEITVLR